MADHFLRWKRSQGELSGIDNTFDVQHEDKHGYARKGSFAGIFDKWKDKKPVNNKNGKVFTTKFKKGIQEDRNHNKIQTLSTEYTTSKSNIIEQNRTTMATQSEQKDSFSTTVFSKTSKPREGFSKTRVGVWTQENTDMSSLTTPVNQGFSENRSTSVPIPTTNHIRSTFPEFRRLKTGRSQPRFRTRPGNRNTDYFTTTETAVFIRDGKLRTTPSSNRHGRVLRQPPRHSSTGDGSTEWLIPMAAIAGGLFVLAVGLLIFLGYRRFSRSCRTPPTDFDSEMYVQYKLSKRNNSRPPLPEPRHSPEGHQIPARTESCVYASIDISEMDPPVSPTKRRKDDPLPLVPGEYLEFEPVVKYDYAATCRRDQLLRESSSEEWGKIGGDNPDQRYVETMTYSSYVAFEK